MISSEEIRKYLIRSCWGIIALAIVTCIAISFSEKRYVNGGAVYFLNKGVVSFGKPEHGKYGIATSGMYGSFSEYPALFGLTSRVGDALPQDLSGIRILVMTNLDFPFTDQEKRRIWDYVNNGGNLWVLGDHTFIKNGTNYLNDLLAPCAIKFNHDSAKFIVQGWFDSYRIPYSPPFYALQNDSENTWGILVGASLDIRCPAMPVLMGRFGYSDWGTSVSKKGREYLGDFEYQRNERLGDLVLVAGQKYGKGKVLVFGDTTSFFNNNTPRTYELIRMVLTYFLDDSFSGIINLACCCLLSLACLILFVLQKPSCSCFRIICLIMLICIPALVYKNSSRLIPYDGKAALNKLAVIDVSHNPNFSKHGSMANSVQGLNINLMRNDLLPVMQNTWDMELLNNSRLFFIIAPRDAFTSDEARDVHEFMRSGGTVILACGRPEVNCCENIIQKYGLDIANRPLGRFFNEEAFGNNLSFYSCWSIDVLDKDGLETLVSHEGMPVIVEKKVQKGRLVLIADSQFFQNGNLEEMYTCDVNNVLFIKNLLEYLTPQ